MKIRAYLHHRRRITAFSLIELIVVISIIALLAALIIPVAGLVGKKKRIALAKAELNVVTSAIEEYKTKLGYYPPDNTNNVVTNQLYFELMGTTNDGTAGTPPKQWGTMDGSALVDNFKSANVATFFSAQGMANTSTRLRSDDSGTAASTFLINLKPTQIGVIDPQGSPLVKILVCSVPWPTADKNSPIFNTTLNPWRYNVSHPTNNVGSYDLWVDLVFGNKTNRICNWSPDPINVL